MITFVEKANLPKGKVAAVICGVLCRELNDYLDSVDIKRIVITPNEDIDPSVKYHADMAVIHLGLDRILIDRNQKVLCQKLCEMGFDVKFTDREIKGEYPDDIGLNFAIVGDNIVGRQAFADRNLIALTDKLNRVDVKQGYCKCSTLVVSEEAVITDDESVGRNFSDCGIDVLLISKGDILLEGHGYGFIGGASCKLSEDELLFFGDITKHRDYKKIAGFINRHGCKIKYLDFPLTDFGGIIPITEKAP